MFRGSLAFLLIVGGLCGECLGVLLLAGASAEHGSAEGTMLSAALGFFLLAFSCTILIAAIIRIRRLSQPTS
jgi:drug/metabolite transporter (DMT)-like permease